LLLLHLPALDWGGTPAIFCIASISHSDRGEGMPPNFDSRITLLHTGSEPVENGALEAQIYANGALLPCRISTLNGHTFISTRHYGVQTISGSGCRSDRWNPGERIALDLSDGTIRPGDRVRVDIIRSADGTVISRDSATA
ncbi:MAG: type IV pilin, partial [Methanomicrobiaceae archaeon]|nr:type IV pilin [Methanomicrobiaceae archaeon]